MMQQDGHDLRDVIDAIDPCCLEYNEWLSVGFALHDGGYPMAVWEEWSRRDSARYHTNECEKKWRSFGNSSGKPITGGSIVQLAKDQGWTPPRGSYSGPDVAFGWDSPICCDEAAVVDPTWVEEREVTEPAVWNPIKQATAYLEALFEPGENVGYVVSAYEKDGRWIPQNKGGYSRTAGQLIEELATNQNIETTFGTPNEIAGAWVRFNPLDGKDVRNDNVTEFRYALVESDDMEIGKQKAIIEELELPVAVLVHSGGKSLHAIVRVDARDYDEYRKRVDYLYKVCASNGLSIDTQNKNPSRLSRLPGFMRDGHKQFIVAMNIGRASWAEWHDWMEELNDGLPDIEEFDDWDTVPAPPVPIVADLLYPGDKMMLAGRSKAGKSFALIELCCAIAEGATWLGKQCQQGKVLYINLELKKDDRKRRFKRVYEGLGLDHTNMSNIHNLDLRGKSAPLDKLSNSIIRRAAKSRYQAIIIDPIYKVISGDENSAEHVSQFCNQLDKLAETLGCAVIYCHHHSKGGQGQKASMDRASGSGVFSRDADDVLDMIELELSDDVITQQQNMAVCEALTKFMDEFGPKNWREEVSQDDQLMAGLFEGHCQKLLAGDQSAQAYVIALANEIRESKSSVSAWRIEGTLREFPRFNPIDVWFEWPVHRVDETGILKDVATNGSEAGSWQGKPGKDRRKSTPEEREKKKNEELEAAYNSCSLSGDYSLKSISGYLACSEKTVRNYAKNHPSFSVTDGVLVRNDNV